MTISSVLMASFFLGCGVLVAACSASGVRASGVAPESDADADGGPPPDGGTPGDSAADASEEIPARVFTTATVYAAKSLGGGATGVAGADKVCANAAEAGGLKGTWVAWLSTSTTNAIDHVTGTGPWYLVDGKTLVFPNRASLATVPRAGIEMNELGVEGETTRQVWTGTANGGVASTFTCGDWSNGTNTARGMMGIAGQKDEWTNFFEEPCDRERSVYCFEVKP